MILMPYGQPGTGKSTLATGIALDYLAKGRRVAANFAIDAAPASTSARKPLANGFVTVIPSRPSFEQVDALGFGWWPDEFGREDRAGLLLIDEAGPWLNSRTWAEKDRARIIDWLLQSRKRGWDVILIAQAPGLIDKQVRDAVIEGFARIRRTDRIKIPVIGLSLPRFHIAVARYGLDPNAPIIQRWMYRGTVEHKCFQSHALFGQDEEAPYCTLPPRITKWRGFRPWYVRLLDRLLNPPSRSLQLKPKRPEVEALMALPPDIRVARLKASGLV